MNRSAPRLLLACPQWRGEMASDRRAAVVSDAAEQQFSVLPASRGGAANDAEHRQEVWPLDSLSCGAQCSRIFHTKEFNAGVGHVSGSGQPVD